ncbi:hypothetical protein [Dictyobacter formicarum]|uniref:Uncharacterized protein n=1 Tax=Dictyobacter formicarum TaxID=2778368 RepID=A0ABQ3VQ42_9CHLR|nr:hypothetical protein [Dictyobacter formicarum]GHO87816.1 hypothetical protein KSZ_58220 [Dictyobacter formicarum]
MKSQHTRKISLKRADDLPASQVQQMASPLPPPASRPGHLANAQHAGESSDTYGLELVLERLQRCLLGRISSAEIELLHVCLHQLFENTDLLYGLLLPDLYHHTNQLANSFYLPAVTVDNAPYGGLKIVLQDIEALLERQTSLAQLLLSSAQHIFGALDCSCSLYGANRVKRRLQQEGEDEEKTEMLAALEVAYIPDSTYYQWMQALRLLTARLQYWQQCKHACGSFSIIFASQTLLHPTLSSIDITLNQLRENIQTIFGTILPEFHTIPRGDDATLAVHLLNLMQYVDLLLKHIDRLRGAIQLTANQCMLVSQ